MLCLCKNDFLNKKFPYPPHESLQRLNPHHTPNLYIGWGTRQRRQLLGWPWQVTTELAHEDKTRGPGANFEPVANERISHQWACVWTTTAMIRLPNISILGSFFINNYPLFYPIFFCFANYWHWGKMILFLCLHFQQKSKSFTTTWTYISTVIFPLLLPY